MPATYLLILGSAATGALVSSAFTTATGFFERRSRRNDLLLSKSVEMAEIYVSRLAEMQKTATRAVEVAPYIVQVRWFHKELKHLYQHERLTPKMESFWSEYIDSGRLRDHS